MGAFDDLTAREGVALVDIVRKARALGAEVYVPLLTFGDSRLDAYDGSGAIDPVPAEKSFWDHLTLAGYVLALHDEIRLLPRAYRYAAYAAMKPRCRRWEDIKAELGKETYHSRLIWHAVAVLISVILSNLGVIVMKLLGWL